MTLGNRRRRWPGWLGPHRRWIVVNAVLVTAVVNLVLNGVIAWVSVGGQQTVPLWSVPLLGGPSTLTDTIGTLFVLPLTTSLLCTTSVWHELRSGRLTPLCGSTLWCAVARLPTGRLRQGLVLGTLSALLLGPPVMLLMHALGVGDLSSQAFMIYKVSFAVGLGALVTPLIAVRAMTPAAG
jgi:hypothetical protein